MGERSEGKKRRGRERWSSWISENKIKKKRMKPDIEVKMTISFVTLNEGFKAEQSEDRAKKSIKEFHLEFSTRNQDCDFMLHGEKSLEF